MVENITKEEKFSIRWVIALKDEAEIIIQQYRMKLLSEKSVFPIFKNSEENHWLILSGIGRHNASAATLYLYEKSKAPKWTAWINIGIAGCGEGHFGDLCLVDKITNNSDRKVSFPSAMKNSPFPRMELLTTDIPIIDYSSKELIDMEACAFYDATSKFSSRELISIVKVISDGPSNNIKNLNNILIGHFLDIGWKNPYGETAAVIYAGSNSSQDREGRMRIDETECPGGYGNGARIALWVKTDKDYYPTIIEKDGWCK